MTKGARGGQGWTSLLIRLPTLGQSGRRVTPCGGAEKMADPGGRAG